MRSIVLGLASAVVPDLWGPRDRRSHEPLAPGDPRRGSGGDAGAEGRHRRRFAGSPPAVRPGCHQARDQFWPQPGGWGPLERFKVRGRACTGLTARSLLMVSPFPSRL